MKLECPECEQSYVITQTRGEELLYYGLSIEVTIPIRHCAYCQFDWYDSEAEDIKTNAIIKALFDRVKELEERVKELEKEDD